MDPRAEFVEVLRIEATLPVSEARDGSIVLVSTQQRGQVPGIFVDALPHIAAQCIHRGSHILATLEQIEGYRAKQHLDAEAVRIEVLKSKQQMVVPMDPALFNTHFQPVAEARQPQRGAK